MLRREINVSQVDIVTPLPSSPRSPHPRVPENLWKSQRIPNNEELTAYKDPKEFFRISRDLPTMIKNPSESLKSQKNSLAMFKSLR